MTPQPRTAFVCHIRFLAHLLRINIASSVALRSAFLMQAGFMLMNNLIFFCVWLLFFAKFPELRGWRLHDIAALYGIVAGAFGLAMLLGGGVRFLAKKIYDGDLDCFLSQPKNALLYLMGSHSFASGWGDIVSGIFLIAFSGYLTISHLPLLLLILITSTAVFLAAAVLINSLAFWFGNTDALGRQLVEFVVTFSVYPQVVFSGLMKVFLFTIIPAGFIGFLPVELLRNFTLLNACFYIAGSLGYCAIAYHVFYRGLKRYESGNHFGIRA